MNNSSRTALETIPEEQQQLVVNSKPSLHRPDMSVTSLLTTSTSTITDKYISIGSPYLSPLRHKSLEGLRTVSWRRRKPTDADNHISLYMTSAIVDEDTTPLWTPCPKYRATTRQWHSVEVGDVGYLEESGEFTTLFNIFHSHKGNIRRGAQPPPPHHFDKLAAQMSDVVTEVPLQRGHFYLSENIERHSGTPQGSFQFTFKRKSGRSGAIIVLPHGGTKSTLRSKFFRAPHVKQYFRENAASWYQHVNAHPDIPNLPNGSLIFVHGTHLARTWGIATFLSKHSVREPERIIFAPTDYSNPYEYQWDWTSEKWKVKSGPSPEELRNGQLLENQCIGIIGSSVVLDDQTWQTFFSNSPTSATSSSSRKASGSFRSRILSSVSSISSIKVGDRPSGRRYMASYLETQRGYEDDLLRMDVD
ncbi:hypothetical protein BDN70DRAFT_352729 [Pholiota conissans]|uniref:Uncharacterized protein n=1 Tax=Pholiota conissans TaxID=109636 RepID=A0A9P5YR08_9AGAR|nr:hypothetical protein BDN70DRAFT_352729 [Pholiota conissans]